MPGGNNRISNATLVDNNREITHLGNIASLDFDCLDSRGITRNNNDVSAVSSFIVMPRRKQ